jgi:GntR family transcriptional regulator, transcriptional repressor for pyruvate dehydrogenase complex
VATTFEPITRQTITDQVRAQLSGRIVSGELAPGSTLPSERALSEGFGVARTSVREALQGLISTGLAHRRGNRVHVAEHLPTVAVSHDAQAADARKRYVRQLFETRRVLELPVFELACERASAAQRHDVSKLAQQFSPGLDLETFRALDRRFHTTIAVACGNPLLVELYGKVLSALFASREFESLLYDEANSANVIDIVERSGDDHHHIATAFRAGDVAAVVTATERHLQNVERRMIEELV